ncbi:MAG: hypothetical protein PHC66_02635 [Candidatus Nanoarchaeia archaeon]|nr:hypothetical protein [Candidatus Nanoarchaeia archaeon]MDD5239679.1 hypothetical protein [Candidatus Nanoarchaeia archaeon]
MAYEVRNEAYKNLMLSSGITREEIKEMKDLERRWSDYRRMVDLGAVCGK